MQEDNGIKIADPDGGVLSMSWEQHCTDLANAPDDGVVDAVQVSLLGSSVAYLCFLIAAGARRRRRRRWFILTTVDSVRQLEVFLFR